MCSEGEEEEAEFGAFLGDESCLGDGGMLLQKLWDSGRWRQLKNCPGRYVSRDKGNASLQPLELLRRSIGARVERWIAVCANIEKEGKDRITVVRFVDGGGLLTYNKGEGVFVHTLNTESGLCRKLIAMQVDDQFTDKLPDDDAWINDEERKEEQGESDDARWQEEREQGRMLFRIHLRLLSYFEEGSLNPLAAAVCSSVGTRLWRRIHSNTL